MFFFYPLHVVVVPCRPASLSEGGGQEKDISDPINIIKLVLHSHHPHTHTHHTPPPPTSKNRGQPASTRAGRSSTRTPFLI